jgi:CheY-like chemotaxis protein
MQPDVYHDILTSLNEAQRKFEAARDTWSTDDEGLFAGLRLLRAELLKRESGHPFGHLGDPDIIRRAIEGGTAGPSGGPFSVLIVDDEPSVRAIVRLLINLESDMEVAAEAANGAEAIAAFLHHRPDVVIMDINMPVVGGLEATRAIVAHHPNAKVVIYTANRDESIPQLAQKAGASGLLYKPANRELLLSTLREVNAGATMAGALKPMLA